MKILGESNDNYIAEVNKDEMANILGLFSRYSYGGEYKRPMSGDEIDISEIYKKAQTVHRVKNEIKDLERLIDDLNNITEELKPFKEVGV